MGAKRRRKEGRAGRVSQRRRRGRARRAGPGAKAPEQPRQLCETTFSEGENLLTAWYQRGGGGRVQASGFLSLQRRYHLQPALPRAILAAAGRKDLREPGHTCSVPSTAKSSSVSFVSDIQGVSTNLKHYAANTKNSLRNWVKLTGVNILFVLCEYWTTDLDEESTIYICSVH